MAKSYYLQVIEQWPDPIDPNEPVGVPDHILESETIKVKDKDKAKAYLKILKQGKFKDKLVIAKYVIDEPNTPSIGEILEEDI